MAWNARLDWGEEVFILLIVLPLPVLFVACLTWLTPWFYHHSKK